MTQLPRPIGMPATLAVCLVNPHHVKAIPGRKTDAKDCEWFAELLQHGLVRGSFVPPTEIQDLREFVIGDQS